MHPNNCSGCPHCDEEMAAILGDDIAGRYESAANRLDAITVRTLRALGAKPNHPAYRALRSREVKSIKTEDMVSAIEMFRDTSRRKDLGRDRVAALLSAGQSTPTFRPSSRNLATCGSVPAAPDLAAAIRAVREE